MEKNSNKRKPGVKTSKASPESNTRIRCTQNSCGIELDSIGEVEEISKLFKICNEKTFDGFGIDEGPQNKKVSFFDCTS